MFLGKIIGTVVATQKETSLEGLKFLVVQRLDAQADAAGGYVVAADAVGAGVGEIVMVASGSSARQTTFTKNRPCDAVIMAIVDSWEVDSEEIYHKHRDD